MGSDGCSIFMFSWLGHQSRFDLAPTAVCVNGHFASVDICSLLWLVGRRHPLRANAGRLPVSRQGAQLLFRREPGAVRPLPPPASRLDIRRWYAAWRSLLMPALRSVSSGVVMGSGGAGESVDS